MKDSISLSWHINRAILPFTIVFIAGGYVLFIHDKAVDYFDTHLESSIFSSFLLVFAIILIIIGLLKIVSSALEPLPKKIREKYEWQENQQSTKGIWNW